MQPLALVDDLLVRIDRTQRHNKQTVGCIVGGGNSAHIVCNLFTRNNIKTYVISRRPKQWNSNGITMYLDNKIYHGQSFIASNDFEYCQEADIIILCCPVNAEIELLIKMKPFVKRTTLLGTVFGQARFDKMVEYIFGDNQPCFAFIQIPWICRYRKYGAEVDNLGDQDVDLAFREKDKLLLQQLDMKWIEYIHTNKTSKINSTTFIREWFFPSNNIIHPGICFGRYLIQSQCKYFYRELEYNKMAGASIEQLDAERIKVINALNDKYKLNINNMSIIKLWRDIWNIEGQSMCQCIQNEASVQNITVHPNIHKDGNHRFFCDDIPYGLCYIKHLH